MRKSILVLLGLLITAFAAAQPPLQSEYYPLLVGHRWTYRAFDLRNGQAKADPMQKVVVEVDRQEPFVRKVADKEGKEVDQKHIGFLLKSTSGGKTTLDQVVVLNEGIHKIHVAGTQMTPPFLFFKLPLKPGEEWEVNSTSGNTSVKGTFTAKMERVKVPFGTVDAWLISFRDHRPADQRVEVDYWFARGVGMVKQRVKAKDHEIMLELEKFEPAK